MEKSSSLYSNPNQFHSGIIDVFKEYHVNDNNSKHYKRKGDVQHMISTDIGKKAIFIKGALSASNFIEIPNPELKKVFNYTSTYYYIQFKCSEDSKFSFQLNFSLNNLPVRLNFKYPLAEIKFSRTNAYIIDIPIDLDHQHNLNKFNDEIILKENTEGKKFSAFSFWNLLIINPAEFINDYFADEFKTFGTISSNNLIFKSFVANSKFMIRGLFLSNNLYNIKSLPPSMAFRNSLENSDKLLLHCNIYDMNKVFKSSEELNNDQNTEIKINKQVIGEFKELNYGETKKSKEVNNISKQNLLDTTLLRNHEDEIKELEEKASFIKNEVKDRSLTPNSQKQLIADKVKEINNSTLNKSTSKQPLVTKQDMDLKEMNSDLLRKQMEKANQEALDRRIAVKNVLNKQEERRVALLPDPIMSLKYILGFSSIKCPTIKYCSLEDKKDVIFPSGNMIINFDSSNLKQKFFLGHSKPITSLVMTHDYQILFSAQEGKKAIIRVWKTESTRCIKILTSPYDKISSMSVSKNNKILTTVGQEGYNKELIILWDISDIEDIKVMIKQGSHFNVCQIKFSPYDQNILATCGKENIKFWRIKKDHLGGKAVVLNQYARNSYFLCLDYDNPFMGDNMNKGRLFVGNNMGCIFQVSCNSMELDAVYKIHDTAINAISVNDAFCSTGSEDGYLRVWPIDFSEFLIEAKHDSPIVSIDIAFDALDIICGTKNGSIGTLNIQNKQYKTLLRSPPGNVFSMVVHPDGNFLFTIEENSSVRVWDIENKCEIFQFVSVKDQPTVVTAPKRMHIFATGFSSGTLKVFDIESTTILYECRSFNQAISKVAFIQNGTILVSMSVSGHISLHDVSNEFIQMKIIKIDSPAINSDLSVPVDDTIFATIGPESTCLLVWNTTSYGLRNRIPIEGSLVKSIQFITSKLLIANLENGNLQVFSLSLFEGTLVKELNNLHPQGISALSISKNYKFLLTGGDEGIIKVLDSKMLYKGYVSLHQYIGHSNGIKNLVFIEHKSLVVSVSEKDGIFFWNFLGDLTFSETELLNDFENLANYGSTYFKKSKNTTKENKEPKNTKIKHLEKAYNKNNNSSLDKTNLTNYNNEDESLNESRLKNDLNKSQNINEMRRKIKENIPKKNEREVDKLIMLPLEMEDDNHSVLNYTRGGLKTDISQNLVNNDSFLKLNDIPIKEEIQSKLFFEPKFIPSKVHYE